MIGEAVVIRRLRRLLPRDVYLSWLEAYLPQAAQQRPTSLFIPATVSDRSDGKIGNYVQGNARRAQVLAQRLDPHKLFCSGPIVIGELNPFSILNPDELCWIEAQSEGPALLSIYAPGVEHVRKLAGRDEYEHVLARQWPRWRKNTKTAPGDMLEALVELSFRGGHALYLRVIGKDAKGRIVNKTMGTVFTNHADAYAKDCPLK